MIFLVYIFTLTPLSIHQEIGDVMKTPYELLILMRLELQRLP